MYHKQYNGSIYDHTIYFPKIAHKYNSSFTMNITKYDGLFMWNVNKMYARYVLDLQYMVRSKAEKSDRSIVKTIIKVHGKLKLENSTKSVRKNTMKCCYGYINMDSK
jgi:hypothetical protein